jgi:hypothetical protein
MTTEVLTILISTGSLAIVLLICALLIRRALKRGYISYSGNRPGMPIRTYSRKDVPLGFWAGIGVILFVAIISVLVASVFILAAFGINV